MANHPANSLVKKSHLVSTVGEYFTIFTCSLVFSSLFLLYLLCLDSNITLGRISHP